jgi:hypothetical protein
MTQPPEHEDDEGGQVRPFAAVLQDINHGTLADQLAHDMQKLVTAVTEHSRKGTLTLKIEVAPLRGNADALNVTAHRALKLPEEEPVAAVFFHDGGNLVRDNPSQPTLPLRELNRPSNNLRTTAP